MALTAPANLQATVVSGTEVALTWLPVGGAFAYLIYVDGVSTTASAEPFKNVTGLTPDTEYSFFVTAEGFDGTDSVLSGPSNTVTVTTSAATPDVPDSLAAPGIISAEQTGVDEASITWGAVTDATGYEVRIDGGAAIDVGNTLGYTTTTSLAAGDYDFEVRAYAGAGPDVFSPWSLPSTVIIAALTAPSPSATVLSSGAIEVTWAAVPPADRYQIRIDNDKIFAAGSLLEYIDSGLAPLTTRKYEVRGLIDGTAQVGPWSTPIEATTNRSIKIEIIGRLRRLSSFIADRHITARALNAEFNNILALLNGGTLTVLGPATSSDPDDPVSSPTAAITVAPSGLSFATVPLGTATTAQTLTISNAVAANLVLGDLSVSGDFLLINDTCSGETLATGESCTVGVQFQPAALGLRIGEVRIPSNVVGSPSFVSLSGTGDESGDNTPVLPDPDDPPTDTVATVRTTIAEAPLSSHSVALPASVAGNLLVLYALVRDADPSPLPVGWEELANALIASTPSFKVQLYARIATGAEGASVTFNAGVPTDGLFAAFTVNRSPGATIQGTDGGANTPGTAWPTVAPTGLTETTINTFTDAEIVGDPAFVLTTVAMASRTEDGDTPGTITSHSFPDLSAPQLLNVTNAASIGGLDLALAFVYGANIPLVAGAGAGTMTFSNALYDRVQDVRTYAIHLE